MSVPAYRLTADDLVDADKKTRHAIDPLLSALNRCLTSVIATLNGAQFPSIKTTSFTTDDVGAAYLDIAVGAPLSEAWVTYLAPEDGVLSSVYSCSWVPLPTGARLLFVGMGTLTTYAVTVRYL